MAAQPGHLLTESVETSRYDRLIRFYEEVGPDFAEWSPAFNIHFGYYRCGLNPLRREPMLAEMNRQVLDRLALSDDRANLIVDLGCGVGATVRYAATMFPRTDILGSTVVPWQVATGNEWNVRLGLYPRARLVLADYSRTPLATSSVDGAVAIESACHAGGPAKESFIREAARILKPGARLVVADAFLKNPSRALGRLSGALHEALCRSFVVPELGQIEQLRDALSRHAFDDIIVDDVSWRVAPSALQAPVAVIWSAVKKAVCREPLREQSVNNLKGSFLSGVLGANRWKVGYYLVTARKSPA